VKSLEPAEKIQWDQQTGSLKDLTPEEATAYEELRPLAMETSAVPVSVTGPLHEVSGDYVLSARRLGR
jgi:hypothetical protein